jgi:hypothetical protein
LSDFDRLIEFHGGVAQWPLHLPHEPKIRVRIPQGYKDLRENIALLLWLLFQTISDHTGSDQKQTAALDECYAIISPDEFYNS